MENLINFLKNYTLEELRNGLEVKKETAGTVIKVTIWDDEYEEYLSDSRIITHEGKVQRIGNIACAFI